MMALEREGRVESLSQTYGDEADVEEESESLFFEYNVPLEDSAEIGKRPRTSYKSGVVIKKRDSDRSLDFSAIIGDSSEYGADDPVSEEFYYSNSDDRFSPERNRKQQVHRHSQQPSHDESLQAPRRRISGQSVSFQKDEYRSKAGLSQNSPSRLGMDGHVVTDYGDSKNLMPVHPASGNTNPTSPARNATVSTRESLSWDDSDCGMGDDAKNDDHSSRNQQDSFANLSLSPVDARLSSSQNVSLASSDENSRVRTSSYGGSAERGFSQEPRIPEENRASGASFDDSDASETGGTGFRSRIRDLFNFHTVSILIVRLIPYIYCFCCFKSRNELRGNSFTDRFILSRLNILSFFFSAIQLAAATWLIVVMFIEGMINTFGDDIEDQFNLWNNNAILVLIGGFAFVLLCTCFWTIRIVKEMDLVHALRFLWILLWILPIVAFLNITAFDFYEVTTIWISKFERKRIGSNPFLFTVVFCCLIEAHTSLFSVPQDTIGIVHNYGGLEIASAPQRRMKPYVWCPLMVESVMTPRMSGALTYIIPLNAQRYETKLKRQQP